MKTCNVCREEKPLADFSKGAFKNKDGTVKYKDGHRNVCKPCTAQRYPQKKSYARKHHLNENYGITPEQYEEMLTEQDYRCAVCDIHQDDAPTFVVDHNHHTGAVRGLLCRKCNSGIGFLKDDLATLEAAVAYLKRHGD